MHEERDEARTQTQENELLIRISEDKQKNTPKGGKNRQAGKGLLHSQHNTTKEN